MAGYEYNPLLKLNLQKKDDSATPGDIDRLEGEIEALRGDMSDKVPKFFLSIDELEVEEIGQFQGEPGSDFVPGYFYKRNNPTSINYAENTINIQGSTYLDLSVEESNEYVLKYRQYYIGVVDLSSDIIKVYSSGNIKILLFSPDFFVGNTLIYDGSVANGYCVFPYAVIQNTDTNISRFDTVNPVSVNNGVFYYKGQALQDGHWGSGMGGCPVGVSVESPNLYYIWCYTGAWSFFPILVNNDHSKGGFVTSLSLQCVDRWTTTYGQQYNENIQDYSFTANQLFTRVDAQPSLNPSDFATAEQGTKADTALQSISKGTDGNYVTTTVTAKDSNNQQKVSASLTIQAMSGADSTHKGVAEASDIKDYITNNTATLQQGTNADTALQNIESGTSSNYVTVTVTPKQNNEQQVGATLKIQDINTASESAKGLLEAWNARNYIDTQVYKVSLNFFFYGVQWDENDPSPDCTRIGNMGLHAELPVQNAIIGGLLADDLTFTPFPDQSDWSGETVDGSAGQVMVQIPEYYFKSEVHGTLHKKLISQYPLAGFTKIPVMYISAEKATVDRTDPNTPKLCSVVNASPEFRGGNNTAAWDGTYRSLLGFPATNISLTQFRQYARNRAAGTAWNCAAYHAQRSLYWLFVTEYATLNSQKPYNAAKDVNGYMQGGLGPGVSNWNGDAWNAYNGYNPLIPCGYMLECGNQSAVKNYSVKDADDNILVTFEVNSYRGIQSPFADIWDWMDGILINVQSNDAGGVSTCYVSDDPAKFSSTDFSQYREIGSTPRADNWIKSIFDDEAGDIICKTQGGASTSYYCDFYWGSNLPASGVSLRGVLFGGGASRGSHCGFLYAYSCHVPGYVDPYIGSRLCAFPSP